MNIAPPFAPKPLDKGPGNVIALTIMAKIVIETDEVYKLEDAAAQINIGIATLFRRMRKGEIVPLRLGGRTYITKSEIERVRNKKAEE